MIPSMKVGGIGAVQIQLTNIARRVPDESRKVMLRKAEQIAALARKMVPEDTGALMESIRVEKGYQANGGRLYVNVVAANKVVVLPSGRQVDLNDYALIIHETYGSMNPGERTLQKQRENPGIKVGEKFMTRAADQVRPTVAPEIYRMVDQIIQGETQ